MKKFLVCEHCGNFVGVINDSGVPMICCGEEMKQVVPNTTDAAGEKHVPVVSIDGNMITVKVGEVAHPMLEEHFIQWIYLETDKGGHRIALNPGDKPEAVFNLVDEKPIAVYELCNIHGLWMKEF